MNRNPEPELMNNKEQVKAYARADFSISENNFMKFIKDYLSQNQISIKNNDLIVDLGCGPGNITEKLSLSWPDLKIVGIDGSKEMILEAESRKNNFNSHNKFKNLTYICQDIKKIKLDEITNTQKIKLLVSNSLIHHITDINDFFDCIVSLSNKETINFHKDLKRPIDEKSALKLKKECSSQYSTILTKDYYASLLASYRKNELQNKIFVKNLNLMNVKDDGEKYLILYGKV